MISGVLDRRVSLYRRTPFVVDRAPAGATLTVARQPVRESVLLARVSGGTSNTGTVTVSGNVSGAPASETLSFSGAGFRQTVRRFSSVSGVTTSGLADEATIPSISIEALSPGGEQQFAVALLVSGYPATFSRLRARWSGAIHGVETVGASTLLLPYAETFEPLPNDVLVDETTGDEYLVRDVDLLRAGGRVCRPSHWEASVERRDKST